ncbi:curli production assembly/transport protein CsgE, partial [Escherichia coli]
GRTSDGNGSHASTLKSPSYTKSVSWQHYPIGHDFYRAFSDKWESDYTGNLTINERPSARWGSWITITVNQDVIFQTFLFPLKRDFEKTVVFALIQTEEALNRRQINQALLSTGDLTHDEF